MGCTTSTPVDEPATDKLKKPSSRPKKSPKSSKKKRRSDSQPKPKSKGGQNVQADTGGDKGAVGGEELRQNPEERGESDDAVEDKDAAAHTDHQASPPRHEPSEEKDAASEEKEASIEEKSVDEADEEDEELKQSVAELDDESLAVLLNTERSRGASVGSSPAIMMLRREFERREAVLRQESQRLHREIQKMHDSGGDKSARDKLGSSSVRVTRAALARRLRSRSQVKSDKSATMPESLQKKRRSSISARSPKSPHRQVADGEDGKDDDDDRESSRSIMPSKSVSVARSVTWKDDEYDDDYSTDATGGDTTDATFDDEEYSYASYSTYSLNQYQQQHHLGGTRDRSRTQHLPYPTSSHRAPSASMSMPRRRRKSSNPLLNNPAALLRKSKSGRQLLPTSRRIISPTIRSSSSSVHIQQHRRAHTARVGDIAVDLLRARKSRAASGAAGSGTAAASESRLRRPLLFELARSRMAICREQLRNLEDDKDDEDDKGDDARRHLTLDLAGINLRRLGLKAKNGTAMSRDYQLEFFGLLRALLVELQQNAAAATFGLDLSNCDIDDAFLTSLGVELHELLRLLAKKGRTPKVRKSANEHKQSHAQQTLEKKEEKEDLKPFRLTSMNLAHNRLSVVGIFSMADFARLQLPVAASGSKTSTTSQQTDWDSTSLTEEQKGAPPSGSGGNIEEEKCLPWVLEELSVADQDPCDRPTSKTSTFGLGPSHFEEFLLQSLSDNTSLTHFDFDFDDVASNRLRDQYVSRNRAIKASGVSVPGRSQRVPAFDRLRWEDAQKYAGRDRILCAMVRSSSARGVRTSSQLRISSDVRSKLQESIPSLFKELSTHSRSHAKHFPSGERKPAALTRPRPHSLPTSSRRKISRDFVEEEDIARTYNDDKTPADTSGGIRSLISPAFGGYFFKPVEKSKPIEMQTFSPAPASTPSGASQTELEAAEEKARARSVREYEARSRLRELYEASDDDEDEDELDALLKIPREAHHFASIIEKRSESKSTSDAPNVTLRLEKAFSTFPLTDFSKRPVGLFQSGDDSLSADFSKVRTGALIVDSPAHAFGM